MSRVEPPPVSHPASSDGHTESGAKSLLNLPGCRRRPVEACGPSRRSRRFVAALAPARAGRMRTISEQPFGLPREYQAREIVWPWPSPNHHAGSERLRRENRYMSSYGFPLSREYKTGILTKTDAPGKAFRVSGFEFRVHDIHRWLVPFMQLLRRVGNSKSNQATNFGIRTRNAKLEARNVPF